MKIFTDLNGCADRKKPTIITIGNFDGVHLGHQYLINSAAEEASKLRASLTLITFSNHPLEILKPDYPLKTIYSLDHKLKLLAGLAVDNLFLLRFTRELADLTPAQFIDMLRKKISFISFILGPDAVIGRNRTGGRETLSLLAVQKKFSLTYLKPLFLRGRPVCSSLIRESITRGEVEEAAFSLGRDYSFYARVGGKNGDALLLEPADRRVIALASGRYNVRFFSAGRLHFGEIIVDRSMKLKSSSASALQEDNLEFTVCQKMHHLP